MPFPSPPYFTSKCRIYHIRNYKWIIIDQQQTSLGCFEEFHLLDHQESGQVIFIDQKEKMPTWLDGKSKCKYHEFTKSREHGRYGLLLDVHDEE